MEKNEVQNEKGFQIQQSIRRVLMDHWDPIGVKGMPGAEDEYDSYIGPIYRMLTSGASTEDLVERLFHIEVFTIGLTTKPNRREELREVAGKLLELNISH